MTELLPGEQVTLLLLAANSCEQPGVSNQVPVFATSDVVPFRFTPNMQNFLGPIFTEGILTSGILAIARCLTEPEVIRPLSPRSQT